MSLEIIYSDYFRKEAKRLNKRYRSFADDLEEFVNGLKSNPLQGVELAPHIRKVRLSISSKGKGKSGGARVITYNALISDCEGVIALLLLYDKSESSNIKKEVVKKIVEELGLDE